MGEMKKKYLKILRIEIEDLKYDVEGLIEECNKEHETGELSEYVFLENLVIFRRELLGLGVFSHILDSIEPDRYENLDEMVEFIRKSFIEKLKEHNLLKAIILYVERKLEKVEKYVNQ